jgi:succinate dehydrogenase / fumarate reductase iron-sulfur subunit
VATSASSPLQVDIYRYHPEFDTEPRMQRYELDTGGRDLMVLDVLERLKREDPTLTYRRSCREGVCGSDGMNMNGKNGLACITRVSETVGRRGTLILRPLPGLPVIRDLVVDMEIFSRQYEKVRPWLINDEPAPEIERLQSPAQRARLDGLYECILCACCSSACPSWWWNPDRYIGPAGLLNAYRFIEDSRDTARAERLEDLQDPYSVYRCHNIQSCTWVCPKGLNPMGAIDGIRKALLLRSE